MWHMCKTLGMFQTQNSSVSEENLPPYNISLRLLLYKHDSFPNFH